jgi:hypothetical protein
VREGGRRAAVVGNSGESYHVLWYTSWSNDGGKRASTSSRARVTFDPRELAGILGLLLRRVPACAHYGALVACQEPSY